MAAWRNDFRNSSQKSRSNEHRELLVFGYACKLFRDDSRAIQTEDPSSLIPWMGDKSLLIDRFDGRGHLYSLDEYDSSKRALPSTPLSDEERAVEKACDEERYMELHVDVQEREMYEEEEVKRLYEALADDNTYQAVQFSYESPCPNETTVSPPKKKTLIDPDDEPFICPFEISSHLPKGIILPPKAKLHTIIEKTALFVSQHGGQFEIMIKAKQKDNIQFRFMDIDHSLNRYYKLMIDLIKAGKYTPPDDKPEEKEEVDEPPLEEVEEVVEDKNGIEVDEENDSSDDEGYYLHPSLMSKHKPKSKSPPKNSEHEISHVQSQGNSVWAQYPQFPPAPPPPSIIPPPPNLKPIIDKMAEYVARNGTDFENNVRMKDDDRFQFLQHSHVFFPYYDHRKHKFLEQIEEERILKDQLPMPKPESPSKMCERATETAAKKSSGVSFSIKTKEVESTLAPKPAYAALAEDSDSGSNSDSERVDKSPRSQSRTATPPVGAKSDALPGDDSIVEELDNRLETVLNGAQVPEKSQQEKLAERKRKAMAFVNLLKKAKTDETYDLKMSPSRTESPSRRSISRSRSATQSPLPSLPDI